VFQLGLRLPGVPAATWLIAIPPAVLATFVI
jgi:hypothetical protein